MCANSFDGNDSIKVCEALAPVIESLRQGEGPFFLEFSTYRWREHCGPNFDNDLGYRTIDEYEEWKSCDPIPHLFQELKSQNICDDSNLSKIEMKVKGLVDEAFAHAISSPFPEVSEAFKHVYAEK